MGRIESVMVKVVQINTRGGNVEMLMTLCSWDIQSITSRPPGHELWGMLLDAFLEAGRIVQANATELNPIFLSQGIIVFLAQFYQNMLSQERGKVTYLG